MKKVLALITLSLCAVGAQAKVDCIGKVQDWEVTAAGYLYVDGDWDDSSNSQRLCSIVKNLGRVNDPNFDPARGNRRFISSAVCKIWLTTLISASEDNRVVKIKYDVPSTCTEAELGIWTDTRYFPETIRVFSN